VAGKKNILWISLIVLVVSAVMAGVFFAGMKVAASGMDDLREDIGEIAGLRAEIEENTKSIKKNAHGIVASSRAAKESANKIKSLNTNVFRELNKLKSDGSSRQQLAHLEKTLGLKWYKRPGGSHVYCLTPYPLPWHHAQDFAAKVGGTLVVIDDAEENKWLCEAFGTGSEYWIGLTDEHEEGKWQWISGKKPSFINWSAGEPDNYRKMQHHVILNKQTARGAAQPGKWNDITGNEIKIGIIELGK
jgi:hypothetical protein